MISDDLEESQELHTNSARPVGFPVSLQCKGTGHIDSDLPSVEVPSVRRCALEVRVLSLSLQRPLPNSRSMMGMEKCWKTPSSARAGSRRTGRRAHGLGLCVHHNGELASVAAPDRRW